MRPRKVRVSKLLRSLHKTSRKGIAWLVDPEKVIDNNSLERDFSWIKDSGLDLIFVGGSCLNLDNFNEVILSIQSIAGAIPVVIFPGSQLQLTSEADAILFLSLISGRNPEYLIGQQVAAAPIIHQMDIDVLPTAYLLVNESDVTSVQYISQTIPIPNSKPKLALATALAGQFMGMRFFFLDAGSGAKTPVSELVIAEVRREIPYPLIVGGGINSVDKLKTAFNAGADLIVLGNAIEKDPDFLVRALAVKADLNMSLNVNDSILKYN
jgi:putative glycerol-1-phosphate prenyltransferase